MVAALDTTLGADELPYYTFFDAGTKLEWQAARGGHPRAGTVRHRVEVQYGQQLLTLSTCGDHRPGTATRFALLAVRVDP